jgi:transcriptional regulator with XRE-family HTH domain
MNVNERLKKIYDLKGFKSQKEFSDTIGASNALVSNYFANKNLPSFDFLMKIIIAFKDVDARWLLTGEDENLNIIDLSKNVESKNVDNFNNQINLIRKNSGKKNMVSLENSNEKELLQKIIMDKDSHIADLRRTIALLEKNLMKS